MRNISLLSSSSYHQRIFFPSRDFVLLWWFAVFRITKICGNSDLAVTFSDLLRRWLYYANAESWSPGYIAFSSLGLTTASSKLKTLQAICYLRRFSPFIFCVEFPLIGFSYIHSRWSVNAGGLTTHSCMSLLPWLLRIHFGDFFA